MLSCLRRIASLSHPYIHRPSINLTKQINKQISSTQVRRGWEEFFPPGVYEGKNLVDEDPVYGISWSREHLRRKSNSDLHKLWFVLLKERNMLATMREECKRIGIPVPGAERYPGVMKSMHHLKQVLKERENAIYEVEKERRYKFDEAIETEKEAPHLERLKINQNGGETVEENQMRIDEERVTS